METVFRAAERDEYPLVLDFYCCLIDEMHGIPYSPSWKIGIYPTEEYLQQSVQNGQVYLALDGETVMGAFILNNVFGEGYAKAAWLVPAEAGEYSVVHALGIRPRFTKRGLGRMLLRNALLIARNQGKKAVRLDVLKGNRPAERLYTSVGFHLVQTVRLFYGDTGWGDFNLYEFDLSTIPGEAFL